MTFFRAKTVVIFVHTATRLGTRFDIDARCGGVCVKPRACRVEIRIKCRDACARARRTSGVDNNASIDLDGNECARVRFESYGRSRSESD